MQKMAVTLVNEKNLTKKELVVIINHGLQTAEKNYFLSEKKKSVAAAGPFVRSNVLL